MKRNIYTIISLLLCLSACNLNKDDNNLSDKEVITIDGIEESYTVDAVDEIHLSIRPVISPTLKDMSAWWGIAVNNNDKYGFGTKIDTISRDVNLDITRSFEPGEYFLFFYVRNNKSGVSKMMRTMLSAQTPFSQGWWILKSMDDNTTDVDMISDKSQPITDVIRKTLGHPLKGEAVDFISPNFKFPDVEKVKNNGGSAISYVYPLIVASRNDMAVYDLQTGKLVARKDNMFIDVPQSIEISSLSYSFGELYLGYNNQIAVMEYNNGKFLGMFNTPLLGNYELSFEHSCQPKTKPVFYNKATGDFFTIQPGATRPEKLSDEELTNLNADLIAMGPHDINSNQESAKSSILIRNKNTGSLEIFMIQSNLNNKKHGNIIKKYSVDKSKKLNEAELACISKEYHEIFFICEHKIWSYDIESGEEKVQLELAADRGPINYIQSLHLTESDKIPLLCLTFASYNNGNYQLDVYNLLGGNIQKEGMRSYTGRGKVQRVLFSVNDEDGYQFSTPLE